MDEYTVNEDELRKMSNDDLKVLGGKYVVVITIISMILGMWFGLVLFPFRELVFASLLTTVFVGSIASYFVSQYFRLFSRFVKMFKVIDKILTERDGWKDD